VQSSPPRGRPAAHERWRHAGPVITCTADKRHKLMLVFGVLSGILGVMILAGGICAGAAGNIIAGISFGPPVFAAGVITVNNTRGGTAWWTLSAWRDSLGA
jgi:hypothetical protein